MVLAKEKEKTKKSKPLTCYYCGGELEESELVIKPIPLHTKAGVRNYKRKFHLECVSKISEHRDNTEASKEEDDHWDSCYKYMKSLLGIKEGMKLDTHAVMRLRGLRLGQYYPSGNNVKLLKRGYDYEIILMTLKFSSGAIRKTLGEMSFKDQKHKIDYIMKIITSNINFMAVKVESNRATKRKVESSIGQEQNNVVSMADYKARGNVGETKASQIVQELKEEVVEDDIMSLFS